MPVPDGYVPTPPALADYAAAVAFGAERPSEIDGGGRLLLPGLGTGNLYDAVRRYCTPGENWYTPEFDYPMPECVGVESAAGRIDTFRDDHPDADIDIVHGDFLLDEPAGEFDWVLANPPFSRYQNIPPEKREQYRDRFDTATGQFHLHQPFVEQAMRLLRPGGWLTFILPLSMFSTNVNRPLRDVIRQYAAGPLTYLPEPTFDVTVRTCLVCLKNERQSDMGHLWLEPLYGYEVRGLLERLPHVTDVDAAVETYRERARDRQQWVRRLDRREERHATYRFTPRTNQSGLGDFTPA